MNSTTITIKDNSEALARLKDFEKMGHELAHFNGATWYIVAGDTCVMVMDTGNRDNITLSIGSREWSEGYLKGGFKSYDFAECIGFYERALA